MGLSFVCAALEMPEVEMQICRMERIAQARRGVWTVFLKGCFYVGVSFCSLPGCSIFGVGVVLSMDACRVFVWCVLLLP